MILRARLLVPVSHPPISDGAVALSGARIVSIGRWRDLPVAERETVVDLGECALLPGLVNAHCHLDYTDMAGHIQPQRSFADWIKAIVALKAAWSYSDFALSWLRGAQMLLRTGTTTAADVEAVPELLPDVWTATVLRVTTFRELVCIKSRAQAVPMVDRAARELAALPDSAGRVGLSPHATYTTSAELLRCAAQVAGERGWRLTTHVAESAEEFEMFEQAKGPLYEWLRPQRDMSDCGRGSPVQHLERSGYLGEHLLAVHVNCLARGDAALLARRGTHVVHCPRSHEYFGHPPFPRKTLAKAGVNLCLGTDSLASIRRTRGAPAQLDLFAEMRALATAAPDLPPAAILRMATVNGALALGRKGEIGELAPGALADLIALPFNGRPAAAYEAVVHHAGLVTASMIGGRWARPPGAPAG